MLVTYIVLRIVLPGVLDLLVHHPVGLFEDLTDLVIGPKLDIHLHPDELLHDLCLSLETVDLRPVRVLEVVSSQVHSWAQRHQIDHDLDESLLF